MATDGAFLSLYQSESLITHSRGVMDDGDRGVISRAVFFSRRQLVFWWTRKSRLLRFNP